MAGEFDFEPLSEEALALLRADYVMSDGCWGATWGDAQTVREAGEDVTEVVNSMARELRAWRAAGRAWAEADKGITIKTDDIKRYRQGVAKLRALVAHVGGGGE